jgi:hypothetical protein
MLTLAGARKVLRALSVTSISFKKTKNRFHAVTGDSFQHAGLLYL